MRARWCPPVDEHGPHQRPADRADAADDDDDEGEDEDVLAHAHLDREERPEQRAGHGAQPAPTPKSSVKSRRTSTPIASAISRLDAPARTSMPMRVRATRRYRSAATAAPTPMMRRRYAGRTSRAAAHRAGKRRGHRQRHVRAPDDADRLVEDQDERESREHLRQVIARVQRAKHRHLEEHADGRGRGDREHTPKTKEPVACTSAAARNAPRCTAIRGRG